MKADKKNKVWELYLLYPIDEASRIAFAVDKAIAHTNWICMKPLRAVQTNDVVLLLSSSQHRNFARISSTKIISITPFNIMSAPVCYSHKNNANIVKRCDILRFWQKKFIIYASLIVCVSFLPTSSAISALGIVETKNIEKVGNILDVIVEWRQNLNRRI